MNKINMTVLIVISSISVYFSAQYFSSQAISQWELQNQKSIIANNGEIISSLSDELNQLKQTIQKAQEQSFSEISSATIDNSEELKQTKISDSKAFKLLASELTALKKELKEFKEAESLMGNLPSASIATNNAPEETFPEIREKRILQVAKETKQVNQGYDDFLRQGRSDLQWQQEIEVELSKALGSTGTLDEINCTEKLCKFSVSYLFSESINLSLPSVLAGGTSSSTQSDGAGMVIKTVYIARPNISLPIVKLNSDR